MVNVHQQFNRLNSRKSWDTLEQFGLGAREAIQLMSIWGAVGGNSMLLYIAALSNIPQDLCEAAEIDGANKWHQFIYIT